MLVIDDITLRVAGKLLLEGASARIPDGARVGLVGRNGVGKTTLFRAIAGDMPLDHGELALPARARIGRLAQEAPDGPESLIEVVLKADPERNALLAEAETATDPHRIAEIQTRLADIGAHSAPARAAEILSGLGFSHEDQQRPCAEFSGGWRMRVALAATLFAEPDLLLLDEPTNYLDLEGTLWLEEHIARYPRTVIVISHDRDLLDKAIDYHPAHRGRQAHRSTAATIPRSNGSGASVRRSTSSSPRQQEAQRKQLQAFVDRFRAKATKARQAQSRLKLLAKLEPIAARVADEVREFDFSGAREGALAADRRARRRRGRLRRRPSRAAAAVAVDRQRRPHRAAWRERQRQVDLGEAHRRAACADARQAHARRAARRSPISRSISSTSSTRPPAPMTICAG